MFRLKRHYEFTRTIVVRVPLSGDSAETQSFTACFRMLTRGEVEATMPAAGGHPSQCLAACLVGWQGIEDADGKPFPFTPKNREMLLEIPFLCDALMNAYLAAIYGRETPDHRQSGPASSVN